MLPRRFRSEPQPGRPFNRAHGAAALQKSEIAREIKRTEESPELLAAVDDGIRSLDEKGVREYTRAELEQKVRQWARGGSR